MKNQSVKLHDISLLSKHSGNVFNISLFLSASFLLLISALSSALGQTHRKIILKGPGVIRGVVVDSLTGQPVEYASFVVNKLTDSTLFNGTVTDSTGRFILANLPVGNYFTRLSAIGYKSRKRDKLTISSINTEIDFDTIRLVSKSLSTSIVNVTGKKEKLVFEDDKIILNVDRSFGANASEVLENTPMVNVDIDGRISLMGSPGSVIYINGVPARYSGIENPDDLKLISSGDIERIELILNPSIEYSERSDAGIINIIMKKKPGAKISGYIDLTGDTKNHLNSSIGLGFMYKSIFTRGSYVNNYSRYNSASSMMKTIALDEGSNTLGQSSDSENKTGSDRVVLNLGFNPGKENIFNAAYSYYIRNTDIQTLLTNQLTGDKANYLDNFKSDNMTNTRQNFITYSLMYNKQFPEKGRSLSAMVSYIKNFLDMNIKTDKRLLYSTEYQLKQHNTSGNSNNTLLWNLSYVHPLGRSTKFSSGYSGELKKLAMDNFYNNFDTNEQKFIHLPAQRFQSKYYAFMNNVHAELSGIIWDIHYNAGAAVEKLNLKNEEIISGNAFSNSFTSVCPGIGLSKEIFKDHKISLGHSRRINYPENRELNPYIDYTDSTNLTMGNPKLKPSYSSAYGFGYVVTKKDLFIRAGVSYYKMKDVIEEITTQGDARTAITTYKNLASSGSIEGNLYISKTFYGWLTVEPMIRFNKRNYDGSSLNNRTFSWNTSLRSGASFSNLRLQTEFRYSSPEYTSQSKSKAAYYANTSVKALFFDKQLSLTLKIQDIFNTLINDRNIYGTGFYSYKSLRETRRVISLGISYYFQSKADDTIEEPDAPEEYDDF
ncbi:MAG: TonB-dependent receptor domain-containing protein [Ignavibacteriales bacterium]